MENARREAIENHTVASDRQVTRQKIVDILTPDEIREVTKRSDMMGAWAVGVNLVAIAAIFVSMAQAARYPLWVAVPIVVAGMALFGGRQLALSVLVHDAAHGSLFETRWLNTTLTSWICARPLWNDLAKYRAYHFVHHAKTGTAEDPDLVLRDGYPTSPRSMARKLLRDLSGVSGLKYMLGRVLMDAGLIEWTVTGAVVWLPREGRRFHHYARSFIVEATPMLLTNAVLVGTLHLFGHAWLYACWIGAHLTFFMLFLRIRSMAEHAATERSLDMFRNTRTVRAGIIARMLVAPIGVNFHLEHHVLATCPYFRLAKLHHMLRERGAVSEPPTYADVLQLMASGAPAATTG